MNESQKCRRIIELLEPLLEFAKPHEQPEIQERIKRRKRRLVRLEYQAELESANKKDWDSTILHKLKALAVLLNI